MYATNASGVWQLAPWDLATGHHTTVTDHPTGIRYGGVSPGGDHVVWFQDARGSEVGRWVRTPFDGGAPQPLLDGLDDGWSAGISLHPDRTVAGITDGEGHRAWVDDGDGVRELARFAHAFGIAGLCADGRWVALWHTEHGDALHPSTKVVDAGDGAVVGELAGGDGITRVPARWSPVPGDARLALTDDADGRALPVVWDLRAGGQRRLELDLSGEITVADWWPDASALLLVAEHEGRSTLHRYDLDSEDLTTVATPEGTIADAAVRPDGALWYAFATAARPTEVRVQDAGGDRLLLSGATGAHAAPAGTAYRALHYPNGDGDTVHAFVAVPDGDPPYPLVVEAHGGPASHVADALDPYVQAWVDHGFAVLLPNYRGSTGFGKDWEDRLEGDPGRPELIDLRAGRDHLVADGLADPQRSVLTGASWGGYLTLQGLGTQPETWSAGVATVPVADYLTAYADESPDLQEFDRSLFGGTPDEIPERFHERSPLTHVERVVAPVLIITGANDTRCPRRQVDNYVDALVELGVPHAYDVYDAGHGSMEVDEQIRQQELALDFVASHLGTPRAAR